ncbi:type VII toxin-antitoxin system HepT family RNase toxin [Halobacillus massiliensis]|uniref:type VII toxin-antitoxin system HepT family RNase toxin n=1 Tax=Halobacillus massiliensis TaxID=1926286 RepID=UPI0009E41E09|nr:HepT-like ribonuclease domain-containing protein [Halobacillus massiliensis]
MIDDLIICTINSMERSIHRVYEVYEQEPNHLLDVTKQDSIVLNIQRACKAAADLAIHTIAEYHFGLPQTYEESFDLLYRKGVIDQSMKDNVKNLEKFRFMAAEDAKRINLNELKRMIEKDLGELSSFGKQILEYKI